LLLACRIAFSTHLKMCKSLLFLKKQLFSNSG